ncbi:sensor histidine kinase [Croceivirga thetidis]|uniref:histidine kinase n=1 Tax=Croceivirga thetidis TaxID=2721623 RepID=A0ABX1GLE2_9FLAO|nr:ATP-binding protein [Croceivirga thetidis]NKI30722.1 GHKL domain-containing protein [Croceivirga thetidis]
MHPLLKRQLRKFLPEHLQNEPGLQELWDAIGHSYENLEEKVKMIQRATTLSSKELFEANKRLNKETVQQREILGALSNALYSFRTDKCEGEEENGAFDQNELVEGIKHQTNKIIEITSEKDKLLRNLEQRNESLNNYAHMVSHDLKSPIRNVHSLVSWVFEDSNDEFKNKSKENVELIFENLGKMDRLIDGILKHATIDNVEDKNEELDFNKVVESIVSRKSIPKHIKVKIRSKLPTLFINKFRIEQLFDNLISNALRAVEDTEMGIVEIDFKEKEDELLFSVSDNGIGIPQHHQESIFDMFKRLRQDSSATGIGLALVKKIINYYQGDIWISSKENKGTTVFFTINMK